MCKLDSIRCVAKSIYEIDLDFYKKEGIKIILIDLDNTLDSYKTLTPNEKAIDLIERFKRNDLLPIIVSNNRSKRVKQYCKALNVTSLNGCYKPLPFKINKFIKINHYNKKEIILIGDQIMTDAYCAQNLKIKMILTEPLYKEDQWTTRINRQFEKNVKKKLIKRNKLINWRTIYDQD